MISTPKDIKWCTNFSYTLKYACYLFCILGIYLILEYKYRGNKTAFMIFNTDFVLLFRKGGGRISHQQEFTKFKLCECNKQLKITEIMKKKKSSGEMIRWVVNNIPRLAKLMWKRKQKWTALLHYYPNSCTVIEHSLCAYPKSFTTTVPREPCSILITQNQC